MYSSLKPFSRAGANWFPGFEGGIGTSAILYIKDKEVKVLQHYLGTDKKHTVYKAEGVDMAMGLHLLVSLSHQMNYIMAIGSDSQALVKALDNQWPHAGHYILDKIHDMVECLHAKQDGLINQEEKEAVIQAGDSWKGKTNGIIDL